MKPKVYDFLEAQNRLDAVKPRDIILYPNITTLQYPDFATFERWMDKHFEYVIELNQPTQPVWKYKITGVLKKR
ncbi:hypothetical protein [uncultured Mucilaginibacter sp.]|uniref:hypothetical protein n=1 Tax=uncultured Mucilaginibacter sp. TaxID=797541 RepID=UPI0025E70453|nr:hypothetical protein [uncultured Mucilaginibacter sp.]